MFGLVRQMLEQAFETEIPIISYIICNPLQVEQYLRDGALICCSNWSTESLLAITIIIIGWLKLTN